MKPLLFLAGVLAATVVGWRSMAADPVKPAEKPGQATVGTVLLLENDRVLEGDIEHIADQYRVKRSTGETWLPAGRVLGLCANYEEAYLFLRARANLTDPDERLRLAQWCRQYGLPARALDEVKAAVELRPEHAETRRLLNGLLQAQEMATAPVPMKPVVEPTILPVVDVSNESVSQFISRVQPILMNTCIRCHGNGQGGNFHLQRCYQVGSVNRKIMQQNMAAVLAQVDLTRPNMSPLLIKAVSSHSDTMSKAPIKDRREGAYLYLVEWIDVTAKTNPHLLVQRPVEPTPTTVTTASNSSSAGTFAETKVASPAAVVTEKPGVTPIVSTPMPVASLPATPTQADPPKPIQKGEDVVDPGPFNQQNQGNQPPQRRQ